MNGNPANRKQKVYDVNTPEGRAVWEEIRSHFPQRPIIEIKLERLKALALCAWLQEMVGAESPDPQLWHDKAQQVVVARVQRQLEKGLQHEAGDPLVRLTRSEALVLGEWVDRDEFFERLIEPRGNEQLALWAISGPLEQELFVEYSDPKYDSIIKGARDEVLREEQEP